MSTDVAPSHAPPAPPPTEPPPRPGKPPRPGGRAAAEPLLVRLHFLSGFLTAPIVLSLALTGIMFAWNPQIETAMHRDTLTASAPGAPAGALSDQVRAAQQARPGWTILSVTPAAPGVFEGRDTTAVTMSPPAAGEGAGHAPADGAVSVYVDPSTAAVTGEITEANRPGEWLRNLHSSWRLGDNVAPLTELAASWLLVSVLTGLYLRWPVLRRSLRKALLPSLRKPGWRRANAVHTAVGVWLVVGLVGLIGTGLTWTNFAGSRVDDFKSTFSSPAPAVDTTLPGAAPAPAPVGEHAEHGGPPAEPAGPPFPTAEVTVAQIDTVARATADAGLVGLVKYTPPTATGKAWKAELRDTKWPVRPVNLAVDGAAGTVVDRVDFGDRPMLAKATSIGIYFHQATLFGLANQLFLTALALGVIVLIVAGYRMWWLRRRPGSLSFPPRGGPLWRIVPVPLMVVFAGLAYVMPMLAVSFLAYLAIERVVRTMHRKAVSHA